MKTYTFHSDAGHAWLAVKRKELEKLNIIKQISSWSYEKGKTVYLEEDCDATLFIQTMEANNIPFKIKEGKSVDRSPIRSYKLFVDNVDTYQNL